MSTDSLFDRERSALVKLQALVQERAVVEKAIADTYAGAFGEADRDVQRARRANAAARKKNVEEIETIHSLNENGTTNQYGAAQAEADRIRHSARKSMVDLYSGQLKKARQEYEDKLWTVESLLEAGEKQALDNFQELKRKAEASARRIGSLWNSADPLLARVRLNRGHIAFDAKRLPPPTETDPLGKVSKSLEDTDGALARLAASPLRKLTGFAGTLGLILLSAALAAAVCIPLLSFPLNAAVAGGWAVVGGVFLRLLAGVFARRQVRDRGAALGVYLADADRAVRRLAQHAEDSYAKEMAEVANKHAAIKKKTDEFCQPRIEGLERQLSESLNKIDAEHVRKGQAIRAGREGDLETERQRYEQELAGVNAKFDAELAGAEARFAERSAAATEIRDRAWTAMSTKWFDGQAEVSTVLKEMSAFGAARFPLWHEVARAEHALPKDVPPGVRYGVLRVDQFALPEGRPADSRLQPKEPIDTTVPAYLPFPDRAAVLWKAKDEGRASAIASIQATMLRMLTGLPPGKVRFTIIDPVGLGENFAAFMHLADTDEKLVTSRIWTEPAHIEQRLVDLTEHMENVIQKYLRNQYKSIEEYNRAAGEVAEPYRVLVIANFPTNFTPDAARRLISIMASGPACGVCTLVSVDTRGAFPRDFRISELEAVAFSLNWDLGKWKPADPELAAFPLSIDGPPLPDAIASIVRRVGKASQEAARVEVPFEFIAPAPDKIWSLSSAKGFEVPIGRAGATRRQVFTLGRGTAQHALVAGKTGSGKSTLLHALITNLALHYSPDEAELYLIDFKKGVEFKDYANFRLPHARVVAIESEREFGLSVLQRLDGILKERGDAFRNAGVNDLGGYRDYLKKQSPPTAVGGLSRAICPRILFVVDEFQEFFVEDDKLAQEAALLLDRLVRQGRAFGVHVLLGSQTLGGAYSLARSTIDQMAVRIALQCSEADAQLILSKDNSAARLLNRPGEAIYNDANGLLEGNNPFQVVWLPEERREQYLIEMRDRPESAAYPPPLVFEGSSTADFTKNARFNEVSKRAEGPPVVYLGDPIAIKDPTEAVFRTQSASNLLMLGQHEEAAIAMTASALLSLTISSNAVTVIDGTPDDSEHADDLRSVAAALGVAGSVVERSELAASMSELAAELDRRQKGESQDRSPRFLVVHGLHRLRELRKPDDDFGFGRKGDKAASPGENFATILRDGPPLGIHVIAWCDSLTNLQRSLDRQALREFALRVLFQMSNADSSHMIDSPAASRLGRNRALFLEEGTERPEKFRPYGMPPIPWLKEIGERLGGRVPADST